MNLFDAESTRIQQKAGTFRWMTINKDGVLEALTGSPGAPNIALCRSLRRHNTHLNEYFPS